MNLQVRAIFGWALVMVAIPALPLTAALVPEPSTPLVVGILILVGILSGLVGNLFKDEQK